MSSSKGGPGPGPLGEDKMKQYVKISTVRTHLRRSSELAKAAMANVNGGANTISGISISPKTCPYGVVRYACPYFNTDYAAPNCQECKYYPQPDYAAPGNIIADRTDSTE